MHLDLRSWPPYRRLRALECRVAGRLRALEMRTGPWRTGLVVATAAMLLACIYVRPTVQTTWAGRLLADLARDPFPVGVSNVLGFRILTPLISYIVGLRGEGIVITNLFFVWLLLVIVYPQLRSARVSPYYAALGTLALVLSAPNLTVIYYSEGNDALAHLLLAVAYFQRRRAWGLWGCFALSLFNREAALFMLPWLMYLRLRERGWGTAYVFELLAALVPCFVGYMLFRDWMGGRIHVQQDLGHYLGPILNYPLEIWRLTFGYQWLGWLSVFKSMWIVPAFAFVWSRRSHDVAWRNSSLILVVCVYAQFFLAWDATRLLSMAFPLMFMAWEVLFPHNRFNVKHWVAPCFIVSLTVPNLYVSRDIIEMMHGALQAILT